RRGDRLCRPSGAEGLIVGPVQGLMPLATNGRPSGAKRRLEVPMGTNRTPGQFCGRTRREFLWEIGGGFGAVALTGLLSADGFFAARAGAAEPPSPFLNPLAPKP